MIAESYAATHEALISSSFPLRNLSSKLLSEAAYVISVDESGIQTLIKNRYGPTYQPITEILEHAKQNERAVLIVDVSAVV